MQFFFIRYSAVCLSVCVYVCLQYPSIHPSMAVLLKCCTLLVTFQFSFSSQLSFAKCWDNNHKHNKCTFCLDNHVSLIWTHLIVICFITKKPKQKHFVLYLCVNAFECASICELGIIWVCSLFSQLTEGHSSFTLYEMCSNYNQNTGENETICRFKQKRTMGWICAGCFKGLLKVVYNCILIVFSVNSRFTRVLYGMFSP